MEIKKIYWLTYASLMCLAIGLFTSITFSALHHIFLLIPSIYFLNKTNYSSWPKSTWILLALIIAIIMSVLLNQDIAVDGYAPLTRVKYYLFGILGIAPVTSYFNNLAEEERIKKISRILYVFIGVTTLASLSGMSAVFFGYNFLKLKAGFVSRNGGLAGMLMNYAHNMDFFAVLITGLVLYREEIKKFLNLNFLYFAWVINLLGLYTTYTRGAWLAFLVALPFYFLRKHLKSFIFCFLGLLIIGIGAYQIAGKSVIRPDSDKERLSQWVAAIHGFKERPILGLGYMNFEKVCPRIKIEYHVEKPGFCGHAHSNYFEMLASTGLIGFILFLYWQIAWFIEIFKRTDLLARLALPLILVFIVGGQTQATFILGANLFLIMGTYIISMLIKN